LVYEHIFYRKVLKFDSDDHWIILLLIDTMEVRVNERDRGHLASMMGTSYVVDGLNVAKVFLSSGRGGATFGEAAIYSVNGVWGINLVGINVG